MTVEELRELIDSLVDDDISEADFLRLEAELHVNEEARQVYYDRQKLHTGLQIEAESALGKKDSVGGVSHRVGKLDTLLISVLGVLFLALGVLVWKTTQDAKDFRAQRSEPAATGFGVISAEFDAIWENRRDLGKGDLVPTGKLLLASGVAQLELFSGVVLLMEGETDFEVISSMEVSVTRGKIRAHVPELAHGFRVRLASGESINQGAEFAFEVTSEFADIYAMDGEIDWCPDALTHSKLGQGESLRWNLQTRREEQGVSLDGKTLGSVGSFEQILAERNADRLRNWSATSQLLRKDDRLLVYYPMDPSDQGDRELIDASARGVTGTIVRANRTTDRWGRIGGGLDFRPMGSRIRLQVPGEYRSLTLMCWVKIDSLDRWYNSLFLTDGHELHEPHWQIMDDGRLFFSVKAHDAVKKGEDKYIAYSPPIWTPAQSGQWMHIVTVYDGDAATTTHYVNGEAISIDPIPTKMQIEKVRIGSASIGNWSEPLRNDPDFAVRNLNGTMDEFALFSAALSAAEIREIFEVGRP